MKNMMVNRSTALLTLSAYDKMNTSSRHQRKIVFHPENESALYFKEHDVGPASFDLRKGKLPSKYTNQPQFTIP
jgi:hypothetical protein